MSDPTIRRLESTDAFVLSDFPDADRADGIVRCARKVLVDSTRALARTRTYSWAILGHRVSGASAAINAEGDARAAAIEAFCAEMAPSVASGAVSLGAGKGVEPSELEGLGDVVHADADSLVQGVLAAASSAADLDGARVAIEFDGGAGEQLDAALVAAGAQVVAKGTEALETDAEVLLFGSRPGLIDHYVVGSILAPLLVPTGLQALTPRALAVAGRDGRIVLPDFLTTAGPLAAREAQEVAPTIAELTKRCLAHDDGAVLGACSIAEEFLNSWVEELPFGRPIG